ncbi:hypothetical protein [Treponema denticola]|uniref:hypothetical protein n=1 Tax=Treponema denticola TaxID=158 RepID=UPI00210840B2|nr:hypothetical protein [Treponema denticola]UTY23245.1 hypothetical protein E4N78_03155 [Treponema denticola]
MRTKLCSDLQFSLSRYLRNRNELKNVSLSLPQKNSLLSKISLIKAANTYFSQFINRMAEFIRPGGFLYKLTYLKGEN